MNKKNLSEYFNSPEHKNFLDRMEEVKNKYKEETEEFWDSLTYEDKLKAFFYVTSKIYDGDVKVQGSYRYVLYDIFSFSMDAYSLGIDSGYDVIHNLIFDGIEYSKVKNVSKIRIKNGEKLIDFDLSEKQSFEFNCDGEGKILTIEKKMSWWEKENY